MKLIFFTLLLVNATQLSAQVLMSMDDCIRYAVENNNKVSQQETQRANSAIDHQSAKLKHLPSLSAGTGINSSFGRGIDPVTNSYISTSTFGNNISANGSMPVFNGFQLINQSRSAKIAKLRGEEQLHQVQDEVALETMITYAEVLYNAELVQLYNKRIERYTKEEHLMARKCELEVGSEADLLQIRATLAKEQYSAINARSAYQISMVTLKDRMNFPLDDSLTIVDDITPVELYKPSQSIDDIVTNALWSNPKAVSSAHALRMDRLALAMARGAYYPSISLSMGISTSYNKRINSDPDDVFDSYKVQLKNNMGEWIGASVSIPIFNGLQKRFAVAKARNDYAQAQRDHDQELRTLDSEIRKALTELETAHSQWLQAQRNVEYQTEANNAAKQKYEQGALGIIELQTSDNDLFNSQIELRNSYLRHQLKLREVNYYKGIPYTQITNLKL